MFDAVTGLGYRCGVRWMRLYVKLVIAAMLSLAPVGASAFQESSVGAPADARQPAASDIVPGAPKADLADDKATPAPSDSGGTKLSIPGLGTLGVIPKMDFGLELLYGSNNTRIEEPLPDKDDDGLQIRGTIKHRF